MKRVSDSQELWSFRLINQARLEYNFERLKYLTASRLLLQWPLDIEHGVG